MLENKSNFSVVDVDISRSETFSIIFRELFLTDTPHYKIDSNTYGAIRTSWTYHIAFAIAQTSRTMDLTCRFEARGRRDAVIETKEDEPKAVLFAEWEWNYLDVFGKGKEIEKLRDSCWIEKQADALLVTYCPQTDLDDYWQKVAGEWLIPKRTKVTESALFLHVVCFEENFRSRSFQTLNTIVIDGSKVCIWTPLNC